MLANTAFLLTRLQVLHGRAQKKASSGRMLICIKENTAEMLSWNSDRAQSAALVGLLELNNFTLIFFLSPYGYFISTKQLNNGAIILYMKCPWRSEPKGNRIEARNYFEQNWILIQIESGGLSGDIFSRLLMLDGIRRLLTMAELSKTGRL